MDNYEFIDIAKRIATDIPTRYQLGGWGQQQNGIYLFDCVCLIKSILWGFNFSVGGHGGAVYLANGVPDINANRMIEVCNNISYDFNNIEVGEILYLPGHTGIYVGDRNVVEATTAWENKVLFSYISNTGARIKDGRQVYSWEKHGRLPYINYTNGYVTITSFKIDEVTSRSVLISYTFDLPVSLILYSLDGMEYNTLNDNQITSLIPNTTYSIRIKVRRKYTDNYTESDILSFTTLDEPIETKYIVGETIVLNGILYNDPYNDVVVMEVTNYIGTITSVDNHYGSKHPYLIGDLGWCDESDIELYSKPSTSFKDILECIINYILLPITMLLLIILLFFVIIKSII